MAERQKYRPVEDRDLDNVRPRHRGYAPKRLRQAENTETPRMRDAQIKTVNPVTPGDRSMAKGRVYEKGRKNQTRT